MPAAANNQPAPLAAIQVTALAQAVASFDRQQLSWASGYLAGLVASELGPTQPASQALSAPAATVLFGSQTGNGETLAVALQQQLAARGLPANCVNLRDYRPASLKKERFLLLVISTHGEGEPPDDAADFHEFLLGSRAPKLPDLQYAVLALGDSSYEQFCATGKLLDERLAELGARRLQTRVDCDVDYQQPSADWAEQIQDKLGELISSTTAPVLLRSMPAAPTYDVHNPYPAEVLENQKITGRDSSKDVRHLELSLADGTFHYQPGDSLSVIAHNPPTTVAALAAKLGLNLDEQVEGPSRAGSLRDVLSEQVEITRLSRGLLERYAALTDTQALGQLLEDGSAFRDFICRHHLLDLIDQYPARPEPQQLIDMLRRLTPREYSIASSQAIYDDEVHLTVAPVRFAGSDHDNFGVASTHLSDRVEVGSTVNVFVSRNDRFRLPADPQQPIIMIGAGTGIAPFRALMQQREADAATGRNWLIFGDRQARHDFLYQAEWQKYLSDGLLTRMDVAFSRDQADKVYVQHQILQRATEFYGWLEDGAYVYVCGDAAAMAVDVECALQMIVAEQAGLDTEGAAERIKELRRAGRYLKDVY